MVKGGVLFEVRPDFLNIIFTSLGIKGVKSSLYYDINYNKLI